MKLLKEYFQPFIAYKKAEGKTDSTINQYLWIMDCFKPIAGKTLPALKKTDDVLIREQARRHGEHGETRAIIVFRMFLRWLEDEGHALPFKWERVLVPNVREKDQYYLTPQEFEDLVGKIDTSSFYGLRDRVLYEFLWATSCRINEALRVDVEDLDFEKGEIFVHTEKGGDGDKVYISDRLKYWLLIYLEKKPECEPLFVIYNYVSGEPARLSSASARKNLQAYRKLFGIVKKLDHPSFRRGGATYLIENGAHIKEVQYLLRHRSERTTLKAYVKFDKAKVKMVHNRIYSQAPKTELVEVVNNMIKR